MDANQEKKAQLAALGREMRTLPADGEYYALTLTATEHGRVHYSWYSEFSAYTKRSPRRELRRPSLVDPQKMAAIWATSGWSCVVVRSNVHLAVYLRIGGSALVERSIVEGKLMDISGPAEVGFSGVLQGPVSVSLAEPTAVQHAPTPKLRMAILKRDGYRCRACGRGPRDNVDVELHVHHVVPWADGGLTVRTNLITLCHTCHKGLEPHREWTLFELLASTEPLRLPDLDEERQHHHEGVQRYRVLIRKLDGREKQRASKRRTGRRRWEPKRK